MAHQRGSFLPFSFRQSLLLPKPRGKREHPKAAQSFPLPVPSPGYRISGKEVEVRDSGSRHHQLCGCCDLQLIQSRAAPSHGPPARVLPPLSLWLQSLSCCLSRVAKRSTPKPRGPLPFPSEPHGPLLTSPKLPDPGPLSFPSEPRGTLLFYFRTTWTSIYLLAPEPHGSPIYFRTAWSSLSMAAVLVFKSQHQSSSAAPFPTPPTISYTCQHPHILPALLSCHCKSGQVWPHGMEPIISKLSLRPCNQGELLPSYILGGIHSHPPGSKHGHSYLTHP